VQYKLEQRVSVQQLYSRGRGRRVPLYMYNRTNTELNRFDVARALGSRVDSSTAAAGVPAAAAAEAVVSAVPSARRLAAARSRSAPAITGRGRDDSTNVNGWDFFFYPFDRHTLQFVVQTPGFNATTCGTPAIWFDKNGLSNQFPSSGEWRRDGDPWSVKTAAGCSLFVPIARRHTSQLVNQLLPHAFISLASLFSMFLDPTSADTAAGRVSVLFVATLLLVESADSQRINSPTFLWIDLFNVISVGVTTLAFFQTFTIHALALHFGVIVSGVELVCRVALPSLYLLIVTALLVWASDEKHDETGMRAILMSGTGLMAFATIGYLSFDHMRGRPEARATPPRRDRPGRRRDPSYHERGASPVRL